MAQESIATICVAFASPAQLPRALYRDVQPLLDRASREGLKANVILVAGSNVGSFDHTNDLKFVTDALDSLDITGVKSELLVSFADLGTLRFYPSIGLGELCRAEDATLEELTEVIRRVPAIKGIENVPDRLYRDHIRESEATAKYLLALVKSEPDTRLKPLFTLAMFAKTVSLAWRTAGVKLKRVESIIDSTVPNASELGLKSILPVDGVAPSILSFLACHLIEEETQPGELRVPEAATAAARILEAVFKHAERVHAVLKRAKMATMVHGQAPLVDAGQRQSFMKLIFGRRIELMVSGPSGFELKTKGSKSWIDDINADLQSVLSALEQPSGDDARAFRAVAKQVAPKLAALTSVSSPLFTIDSAVLAASMADVLLANRLFSVVTHTKTRAAHVCCQLQIRECAIDVSACAIHLGKTGGEPTIASIFPLPQRQNGDDKLVAFEGSVIEEHKKNQNAARALDRPSSPLGSLIGTITGRFSFDNEEKRAIVWRRRAGEEVLVSIHKAHTLELIFADYKMGSTNGTSRGMNKVAEQFEITSRTRLRLSTLDPASGVFLLTNGGIELLLEERSDDPLGGLSVQWARRGDNFVLVADNAENERLVV